MRIHHTALVVTDVEASLRFWRDALGFVETMDATFDGDWPTLFDAPAPRLRSIFLGDPEHPDSGLVELVDFGPAVDTGQAPAAPTTGFFLLSVYCDVGATLARLADLGLGGEPRRIQAYGVTMVVVTDPTGVRVELIDLP